MYRFEGLYSLNEASELWGIEESKLIKAIENRKLIVDEDCKLFGKEWIVTEIAMTREYGDVQNYNNENIVRLTTVDKEFILENIDNGEDIINSNDIDFILNKISEVMMYEGFDVNDEINDFGRKAEKVYDNIFNNND